MTREERIYYYRSLVSTGDGRKFVIGSILFHFLLFIIIIGGNMLFSSETVVSLRGGGGSGPTIGVGLVEELPRGDEYYKPPVTPIERVAPKIEKPPAIEPEPQKDDFQEDSPAPAPESSKDKNDVPETEPDYSSKIGTAEKPTGVMSGKGAPGEGTTGGGGGHGVSVGGTEDGFLDSWYARQVEQRVSRNWLKSRMGIHYSRKHRVVIQFSVSPDGRISDITILQSTGPVAFERSAIRAVKASDPLPPLPNRYRIQTNRIRFVAVFEYPIP